MENLLHESKSYFPGQKFGKMLPQKIKLLSYIEMILAHA
jgi:hypothetical protein